MCCGCGQRYEKRSLVRLALLGQGTIVADPAQKKGGRGIYLCRKPECFQSAAGRKPPGPVKEQGAGLAWAKVLAEAAQDQGWLDLKGVIE